MMVGLIMGLWMSIATDFILSSVHANLTLMGWVTMAITGLFTSSCPGARERSVAGTHNVRCSSGSNIMM
jgi:hypothetical protein